MRIALGTSLGAALLSTGVALFVVLRTSPDLPPAPIGTAAATTLLDPAGPTTPPVGSEAEATPPLGPAPSAAAMPSSIAWPDLTVEGLPPVDSAPEAMGQSIGSPRDGALLRPSRLPISPHYFIRDPETVWGTRNTIEHLTAAIASVRRRNPTLHRVVIGDISTQRGGPLPGHTSHQSGRDVDLGMFYRGRGEDGPTTFVEATREILDRRATLDLVLALAATRDEPDGVELIVLDYGVQRQLRTAAQSRGIPEDRLQALFQYPHNPQSLHGLIRHKPAHRDHLHVRFRCPQDDPYCRAPLLGFGALEATQPSGS